MGGGDRDTTPPQLDSTKTVVPANGTLNFQASRIIIPFDEYVQLKDKEKQILITPFLETPPEIYVKGKKVIVDFKAPLENNTTYIINFGKSIIDLTEGNEMVNYRYVFSTGSYIDSLKYSASVYDAFNKTPVEGAYVMLYKDHQDSVLLKKKPNYFGVTDAMGNCTIENIASGTYKVLTFQEDNGNYLWEPDNEMIGYSNRLFNAAQDTIVDTMTVFSNQPDELNIEEAMITSSGKGWVAFNQALDKDYRPENDSLVKSFAYKNTVKINPTRDTLFFFVKPTLEAGKKHPVGIQSTTRKTLIPLQPDTSLTFRTNISSGLKPGENPRFQFSQPLSDINELKIEVKTEDKSVQHELVKSGTNGLIIAADWQESVSYEIHLLPGAVRSYRNIENDTIAAYFDVLRPNDVGALATTIAAPKGQYIVELLNEGKVVDRAMLSGTELSKTYGNLLPGTYFLRIIFDENTNGVWDTGSYFDNKQPERIEYYMDPIQIKKGWDMDINWEIRD
ncbi:hypothetical protein CRYO30217_00197 [Parvicella tangerina]|uniref:SbsA Ig-like domain-containing protein n=1 Tax=Parvicella tangerina TaxID=2829795 RepID=A0A916JKZ0_9FLAO|nr:hypothetical protein CRYO30217_00197 [Parvicella tangerina]